MVTTSLWMLLPVFAVLLLVAAGISFLQSVTDVRDTAIAFIPKCVAAALMVLLLGGWWADQWLSFADEALRAAALIRR